MKNRIWHLVFLSCAVLIAFSCGKEDKHLNVEGDWKLVSAQNLGDGIVVKGADEVEIVVYVSFYADGKFELYQQLGEGRFRRYSGTWNLDGNVLSGSYGGRPAVPWGSSYAVSLENDDKTLVMTPQADPKSVMSYSKSLIPDSVKSEALAAN